MKRLPILINALSREMFFKPGCIILKEDGKDHLIDTSTGSYSDQHYTPQGLYVVDIDGKPSPGDYVVENVSGRFCLYQVMGVQEDGFMFLNNMLYPTSLTTIHIDKYAKVVATNDSRLENVPLIHPRYQRRYIEQYNKGGDVSHVILPQDPVHGIIEPRDDRQTYSREEVKEIARFFALKKGPINGERFDKMFDNYNFPI